MALLKFAILPGILGDIACFVGQPHSTLIKANIGVVIGFALQHKYMLPALKELMTASDDFVDQNIKKDNLYLNLRHDGANFAVSPSGYANAHRLRRLALSAHWRGLRRCGEHN